MTEPTPMYDGQPVKIDNLIVDAAQRAMDARNRIIPNPDAERRRKALEQLRRNLKSAVKQVEELLAIEERKDRQAA